MKSSIAAVLLLLAVAATPGCNKASDESEESAVRPSEIQITRFEGAESGTPAPTPFDKTGDLYVLETGCDCVVAINPAGEVRVVLTEKQILDVTGSGRVSMSGSGIAFDSAGTLYFVEGDSDSILKLERGGILTTLVDSEALTQATGQPSADPEGLAAGSAGQLYVNDNESDSILRVDTATGSVSVLVTGEDLGTLVGLEKADLTPGLAVGEGGIVYTTNNDEPQAVLGIESANQTGVVAVSRLFEALNGYMTVAENGDLVLMDTDAEVVFRVSSVGEVTTYLSEVQLQAPIGGEDGKYRGGIAFDSEGNLYVTEQHENHIMKYDPGFQGSIWVDRKVIQTATRSVPDLDGGIAFAPRLD